MTLSKIWVYAEAADAKVSSTTLEVLTKARELADTVEAIYVGGDADAIAASLGAHGVTTIHSTGDIGDVLPGPPVAAAIAAAVATGAPDAIVFGTSYAARDVAGRLSVALDRPVLTNGTDLGVDASKVNVTTPVFGGTLNVTTTFTGAGPALVLIRPKSFAAEESGGGPAAVETLAVPDVGASSGAKITARHVEEREGPQLEDASIVVSGGRGLGEADKYQMIEDLAKLLKAAPGASRAPSSTPVGCPTAIRSARPARSSSPTSTSPPASRAPPSTWWA